MTKKIFRKLDTLLSNKWIGGLINNFISIFPLSEIKKNILFNKKEFSEGKIYLSSYPYKGVLNLTDVCNFRCKFCEIHYVSKKYPIQYKNFINVDTLEKYYPLLSKMKTLAFYGATGEPLLNPFFPDIIKFLKKRNPEIWLSINTNGSLLNEKVIKTIIDVGFNDVLVSIHATSKNTYQYLVGGNYDQLLKNIELLLNERNKKGKKVPKVGLTFALNKINAEDAIYYPELGRKLGVDYININHYYDVRNQLPKEVSFYFSPKEGNEILKKIYEKAHKLKVKITPPKPPFLSEEYNKDTDLLKEYNKQILKKNICCELFTTLKFKGCIERPNSQYITSCNRILLLRMNYEEYNFENPHRDIWNHPVFLYMRATASNPPYNSICRFCRNRMTPIIRCLDNALYRELRDKAVKEFFQEVKSKYKVPEIKGIEMLENNPYE